MKEKDNISIIPQPVKYKITGEDFILSSDTVIQFHDKAKDIAKYLQGKLNIPTGFNIQLMEYEEGTAKDKAIFIELKEIGLGDEGYKIQIDHDKVFLLGSDKRGLFYAIQTLRQLFPIEIECSRKVDKDWILPGVKIIDYPRFYWRGFMFDEGRHFHGKRVVKRMLDLMALHKLNFFHWHITEDQGWRIEIKKYPKLTEIGSRRNQSQIGGYKSFLRQKFNGKQHAGYYTQEEINEIIEYAGERFITVVPEFDVPGHVQSALAAYPEYSCTGGPFEVATTWGIKKDVFCLGKDSTLEFVEDIFSELIELFPSPYIHIGGDEAPITRWKKCPNCQNRLKKEQLESYRSLQHFFTQRITRFLIQQGRIPIGWNEILTEKVQDIDPDVIVQHWFRDNDKVLKHLRHGGKVIISRFFYYYLDYPYIMTPLKKTYNFEPIPVELEKEFYQNILGVEAPLWTEWVPDIARIDWQTFPRLTAVAESGWTLKENKGYLSFKRRLRHFLKRLDLLGVKYATDSVVDPSRLKRLLSPVLMFIKDPAKNVRE